MKPEQQIIADWMLRVMQRKSWTAQDWADRANISPTSVSRAIRKDYKSVTTIPTLDKLARAAELPSVLNFLRQS